MSQDLLSLNNLNSDAHLTSQNTPIETAITLAWVMANLRSKDPTSKVGCAVYNGNTGQMWFGYNGFPRGIKDLRYRWQTRATKLKIVNHAERNAIAAAQSSLGYDLRSCTLLITHWPCIRCVVDFIIPSNIKHIMVCRAAPDRHKDLEALMLLEEAGSFIENNLPDPQDILRQSLGCIFTNPPIG